MQQRKRSLPRIERFLRQPQHHARVLADRVQHHWPRKLGNSLAQDRDALSFKGLQIVQSTDGRALQVLPLVQGNPQESGSLRVPQRLRSAYYAWVWFLNAIRLRSSLIP